MAIQTVGIAYRHRGYHAVAVETLRAAVTDRLASPTLAQLHDTGLESRHGTKLVIMAITVTVKPQPQTAHVESRFGKAFYGGRVGRVAQYAVRQRGGQRGAHTVEQRDLSAREIVLRRIVGARQMGEDGRRAHGARLAERLRQPRDLAVDEAQTVHARIEFDMYRIVVSAVTLHAAHEIGQRTETVNLGFERVGHHLVEAPRIGVKHHYGHRYTLLAQDYAFVGERHGQIVDPQALHELRHLGVARAIGAGLDHSHQSMVHGQESAEITDVMRHVVQVHLQDRGMAATLQGVAHAFEVRPTVALEQNGAPRGILGFQSAQEVVGGIVKAGRAAELVAVGADPLADADQQIDPRARCELRGASIELFVAHAALQNIRDDGGGLSAHGHAAQGVERDGQRIDIGIVGVVDYGRAVDALLNLQTHSRIGRLQTRFGITQHAAERLDLRRIDAKRLVARRQLRHVGLGGILDAARRRQQRRQRIGDLAVRAVIYKGTRSARKHHLLGDLLPEARKVALVGVAYGGEKHHVGTYHALQTLHLAALGDTRLDKGDLLVALDHKQRQRHAQLRIVAGGRGEKPRRGGQRRGRPLLYDRLAVRSRNADHRAAERRAMRRRQTLQRLQRVVDDHISRTARNLPPVGAFDHEAAHAAAVHLVRVVVRIVVRAAHGHEHRSLGESAAARVGHHIVDRHVLAQQLAAAYSSYFRKCVSHLT